MSSQPVLLLFGSGSNVGLATAKKFVAEGYKVAAISRNPSEELKATASLILPADLTNPSVVADIFAQTTAKLGVPDVVIYNAGDGQFVATENPLTVTLERLTATLNINTVSAYAAASEAVKGFAKLPDSASKTFMFTGNMMNTQIHPMSYTLGMGKNATAYMIEMASHAYKGKYRFYYVDERGEDGESVMERIDGKAHGDEFFAISQKKEQGAWDWTFVKGKGYVKNPEVVDRVVREGLTIPGVPETGLSYDQLKAMMQPNTK